LARTLSDSGFSIVATSGTCDYLVEQGLDAKRINKVLQGRPHCVDAIISGDIQLVINTTEGAQAITDSYSIRREALVGNVPHYTTIAGADAAVRAIQSLGNRDLEVNSLQAYLGNRF